MIFFPAVVLSSGIISTVDTSNVLTEAYSSGNTSRLDRLAFSGGGWPPFFDLKELLADMNVATGITNILLYAIDNTYRIISESGVQILIFLSALQNHPPSRSLKPPRWMVRRNGEEFWKITFPMIMPTILVNIVYTVVCSFANPAYGLSAYIQEQAFANNRMGYSSAMSWIYCLLVGDYSRHGVDHHFQTQQISEG